MAEKAIFENSYKSMVQVVNDDLGGQHYRCRECGYEAEDERSMARHLETHRRRNKKGAAE